MVGLSRAVERFCGGVLDRTGFLVRVGEGVRLWFRTEVQLTLGSGMILRPLGPFSVATLAGELLSLILVASGEALHLSLDTSGTTGGFEVIPGEERGLRWTVGL